jgi:4-oxalocrotonate tautomerase
VPLISVNMVSGRSAEAKQRLIKALTDGAVAALDVPVETVRVLIIEIAPEHWAVGGVPKSASDSPSGEKAS